MRAPSLLAQCLPGLLPHDRTSASVSSVSERDVHLTSTAVEILPSKLMANAYKCAVEKFELQGMNVFKGKVTVADGSEMVYSKHDGSLKSSGSSVDLVNILQLEICDGQLSFRGKRVLELGCSYGFPGIFACLKGASMVHFQDQNAETIRSTTIPNVLANLEQAKDKQSRQPESPLLTPSRQHLSPLIRFYAGDWEELPAVLSVVSNERNELTTATSLSLSEEDFSGSCCTQDDGIIEQDTSSRRSRKLSGSQAWERADESDNREGGYDVILMTGVPCPAASVQDLYDLIKKCLRPPYGVVYLAAKRNFVGVNNGFRHLKSLVDEDGVFGAHLVRELTDRDIWKFFLL